MDRVEAGQEFEIERIDRGEYRLVRCVAPSSIGVVDWLLSCPEKGYFTAIESETTDTLCRPHLVDANVLSEPTKPKPSPAVVDWLRRYEREIAVDPIIIGELRFGILLLPRSKRRSRLEGWFEQGVARLQCLAWDLETGMRWAELIANLRKSGRAMPVKDSMIAATALVHGLVVATRNRADFKNVGLRVIDPFVSQ